MQAFWQPAEGLECGAGIAAEHEKLYAASVEELKAEHAEAVASKRHAIVQRMADRLQAEKSKLVLCDPK